MEKNNGTIRERLLSRLPQPENLAAYREEVTSALERNEKRLRIEKWGSGASWLFAVGFFTFWAMKGEKWMDTSAGRSSEAAVFVLLIWGAVELLKHFINRSRVELLKEIKQMQLQMLELQASIENRGA